MMKQRAFIPHNLTCTIANLPIDSFYAIKFKQDECKIM